MSTTLDKKAILLGIIGSFFFAFTFILNRSMHLQGGSWMFSSSLRYLFTLPLIACVVKKNSGFNRIHKALKSNWKAWMLWSFVGFFLFYAPLSFAGDHGESWLVAASWQITIVMGILLTPLFGKKIPVKNLLISVVIIFGVLMLQIQKGNELQADKIAVTLGPIFVAAVAYPLGNRKIMALCDEKITTAERIYGMILCSIPFWILLLLTGMINQGAPGKEQVIQSFCVALFSGVLATMFFFRATDLVKSNPRQLAVVESTQAGEVIFTLIGSILLLGDPLPNIFGWIGIFLIVAGMIMNSMLSQK